MKLFLFAQLMRLCDSACNALHQIERAVQSLRLWAWQRCTKENLRMCNTRQTRRTHF